MRKVWQHDQIEAEVERRVAEQLAQHERQALRTLGHQKLGLETVRQSVVAAIASHPEGSEGAEMSAIEDLTKSVVLNPSVPVSVRQSVQVELEQLRIRSEQLRALRGPSATDADSTNSHAQTTSGNARLNESCERQLVECDERIGVIELTMEYHEENLRQVEANLGSGTTADGGERSNLKAFMSRASTLSRDELLEVLRHYFERIVAMRLDEHDASSKLEALKHSAAAIRDERDQVQAALQATAEAARLAEAKFTAERQELNKSLYYYKKKAKVTRCGKPTTHAPSTLCCVSASFLTTHPVF